MNTIAQFRVATSAPTLAEACATLDAAKRVEAEAITARVAAENQVLALVGNLPAEGTTHRDAGGYKVTIATAIRRTVDSTRLAEIAKDIPEAIGARLIRWKPELVTRELRYVMDNEPGIYAHVALAIDAKPAKPSIKVERVDAPEVA